ncbi:MAG: hypothetical protein AAFX06_06815 [Planctomycetota bacterium]
MIRMLFAGLVLVMVSIVEVGRSPEKLQSATSGRLTINYPDSVSPKTASEAVRILSESSMFAEDKVFELSMGNEDGTAILEIPIVVDALTPELRDLYAIYARLLTDLGDSGPVAIRLSHNGSPIETVAAVRTLGERVFEYEKDFIYHTANLSPDRLNEIAPQLKERGFLGGDQSIIGLAMLDEEFVLEVNLAQDPSDPGAFETQSEFFNGILPVLQQEAFEFAALRIIGCSGSRERYESADWYRAGCRPGMSRMQENGVSLGYGETIAEDVARKVLFTLVDKDKADQNIRASLWREEDHFHFVVYVTRKPGDLAPLQTISTLVGRSVFEALPDAELLHASYVDTQNQPVVARQIREGIGTEVRFGRNLFFHHPDIAADDIQEVQRALNELGLYTEDTASLLRLWKGQEDQLVIQLLFPPETAASFSDEEVRQLEEEWSPKSVWQLGHRIEFVDYEFNAHPRLQWDTRSE